MAVRLERLWRVHWSQHSRVAFGSEKILLGACLMSVAKKDRQFKRIHYSHYSGATRTALEQRRLSVTASSLGAPTGKYALAAAVVVVFRLYREHFQIRAAVPRRFLLTKMSQPRSLSALGSSGLEGNGTIITESVTQ